MSGKRKKNILFVGTANWPQRLSALSNKYLGGEVTARAVTLKVRTVPYLFYWSVRSDSIVRVGVRPGINKWIMRFFDCVWGLLKRLNKKATFFYYWIGTDVWMACKSQSKGDVFLERSKEDTHLVGAPWFIKELQSVGINSELCVFPLDMRFDTKFSHDISEVNVLTYIPDTRSEFYGGESILNLAKLHPDIKFNVVGGIGGWADSGSENVKFHGWLSSINHLLESRPILIRLVPHDAIGGTLREGLAYGCHVICTYDIPGCYKVEFGSFMDLCLKFDEVLGLRSNEETAFNKEGLLYARENWRSEVLIKGLVDRLVREV